ncbi:MAG TPA: DinB family protein [Chloroflexia bacterium]|nr:DinB family protein [Chloroflexia bacterium]
MPFIIHRKPPYRVYVEEGRGVAMAHVAELPGCFAVGSSAAKAVQGVPGAITRFLAWLKRHKEPLVPEAHVSRPNIADLYVADVLQQSPPTVAGSYAALFEFDKEAWNDEKLERSLRWLGYSRTELLSRIEGLSDEELKERKVAPGRSMWATLWHVANAEYGYIHLVAGPLDGSESVTDTEPADVRERLHTTREIFLRRARSVPSSERARILLPSWADRPDEPWTLPKAVRRALEHELEHGAELGFRI